MSFSDAFKTISKGLKDLSQLNVKTYTGDISGHVTGDDVEAMLVASNSTGQLKLVAATTMFLDGDVNQFISSDSSISDSLRATHASAVEAGQRSRKAALDLFIGAVTKTVGKIDADPDQA